MSQNTDALRQMPIEDLQLSLRAYGFLKRTQIQVVADLLHYTEEDLNLLDANCAAEIIAALQEQLGVTLPTDEDSIL